MQGDGGHPAERRQPDLVDDGRCGPTQRFVLEVGEEEKMPEEKRRGQAGGHFASGVSQFWQNSVSTADARRDKSGTRRNRRRRHTTAFCQNQTV